MAAVSNIDTSTLVHLGVEIVVVGGLAFWVHRKTKDLQDQITSLTESVNKYEDILKRQGELLAQHENALRQVFAAMNGKSPPMQSKPTPRKHTSPKRNSGPHPNIDATAHPNIDATFSKLSIEDEDGTNVDDLLTDELAELGVATECDADDTCDLKSDVKKK